MEIFCTSNVSMPMSVSWFSYCTIVLQNVTIGITSYVVHEIFMYYVLKMRMDLYLRIKNVIKK